jgi:hypothetical protein
VAVLRCWRVQRAGQIVRRPFMPAPAPDDASATAAQRQRMSSSMYFFEMAA